MLVAMIDCLVEAELRTLISTLKRDGVVCVSSSSDICDIHDTLGQMSLHTIVIYGKQSMNIPFDDCPCIWLCLGPDVSKDAEEATSLYTLRQQDVHRKEKALQQGFRCMTYVQVLSFMANEQAKKHISNMNVKGKAADIMLRHVRKPTSYIP